jgi:hypothetical protein
MLRLAATMPFGQRSPFSQLMPQLLARPAHQKSPFPRARTHPEPIMGSSRPLCYLGIRA